MGRCIGRERVGLAQAHQFRGAQLGQAFDIGAHLCEIAETGEEFDEILRPARHVGFLKALLEAHAGDLAGARGDRRSQAMLVDDDGALDLLAAVRIVLELIEHHVVHQVLRELRHGMPHSLDVQAHRVEREEVAQDDPEPFHAVKLNRRMGRLIQGSCVLQIIGRGC